MCLICFMYLLWLMCVMICVDVRRVWYVDALAFDVNVCDLYDGMCLMLDVLVC